MRYRVLSGFVLGPGRVAYPGEHITDADVTPEQLRGYKHSGYVVDDPEPEPVAAGDPPMADFSNLGADDDESGGDEQEHDAGSTTGGDEQEHDAGSTTVVDEAKERDPKMKRRR